nr:D-alanyl-D-alanine carboxypeptidase family protein [Defluviimonas aquaemixtae]
MLVLILAPVVVYAAPYAAYVIDARTGRVLHEENAHTRLHPASLTKMMTLYIAFEAIERGEISLDSRVRISKHAASQPPSKLGLRAGQTIALRYLIRAAAIKSANDAATAIGEAIEGSESAFARRMTRTSKALGMTKTTFANANGLTAKGHLSTARDMTLLGRHLFYDYPQYYNLFSRTSADAGIAKVASTNRRFLGAYKGADGIKTGYTSAAGFNLTASAQRGSKRIIATVFGGKSTASRNQRVAELLDLGFGKAPNRVAVQKPARPAYSGEEETEPLILADAPSGSRNLAPGKTIRLNVAVKTSPRPKARPVPGGAEPSETLLVAMQDSIDAVLAEAQEEPAKAAKTEVIAEAVVEAATAPIEVAPTDTEGADVAEAAPVVPEVPQFVQDTAPQPETLAAIAATEAVDEDAPAEAALSLANASSIAPTASPKPAPSPLRLADTEIAEPVELAAATEPDALPETERVSAPADEPAAAPKSRPEQLVLASLAVEEPETAEEPLEVVTRVSTSGGRQWAINVGHYGSRYNAERQLLQTALVEMNTLDEALRKVVAKRGGYDANFVGMTQEIAELACRRLQARQTECTVIGP